MAPDYLDWLSHIFVEAQVPYTKDTTEFLDRALHDIAGVDYPQSSEDEVFRVLRKRYLEVGPPGRQLLSGLIRDAAYSRRDSPLRPIEGTGHFTNAAYGEEDEYA